MSWSSIPEIINKLLPNRKEAAINELHNLEQALGKALVSNNDMLAAAIRKRLRLIREKYPDIDN